MKVIARYEDEVPGDGLLRVTEEDNKDVTVEVHDEHSRDGQCIRFSASKSNSPRTFEALVALWDAMLEDERERPD